MSSCRWRCVLQPSAGHRAGQPWPSAARAAGRPVSTLFQRVTLLSTRRWDTARFGSSTRRSWCGRRRSARPARFLRSACAARRSAGRSASSMPACGWTRCPARRTTACRHARPGTARRLGVAVGGTAGGRWFRRWHAPRSSQPQPACRAGLHAAGGGPGAGRRPRGRLLTLPSPPACACAG